MYSLRCGCRTCLVGGSNMGNMSLTKGIPYPMSSREHSLRIGSKARYSFINTKLREHRCWHITHLSLLMGHSRLVARHWIREIGCLLLRASRFAIIPGCQVAGITCRPEPRLRALEGAHGDVRSGGSAAKTGETNCLANWWRWNSWLLSCGCPPYRTRSNFE